MNIIFVEPAFPANQSEFVRALSDIGANAYVRRPISGRSFDAETSLFSNGMVRRIILNSAKAIVGNVERGVGMTNESDVSRLKRPFAAIGRFVQRCGTASPDQPFVHRAAFCWLNRWSADKVGIERPSCQRSLSG